jgi:hypothetical protein
MNPLLIDAPYSITQFIENLPGYNSNFMTDEMLDLYREIIESGNYYWQGACFPVGAATRIPVIGTLNGSLQIPAGSYITSMTYYCDPGTTQTPVNPEGIKIKLYDKGSKASIFFGDYALDRTVMSNMALRYGIGTSTPPTDQGSNVDNPVGPNLLMSPFIVTPPGMINWEIVNLSSDVDGAVVQVMLGVAVPISKGSIGNQQVKRGY